ncbi:uncharacterized protein LOC111027488 [Myzus persicae]|uniref:uncharacterized protein LOC111027488 n=1 Tax=Myzus persicae TaxID=13164 RepID=UPI000B934A2B|nr:uncharacterized protein LOC111027488 [Myzus persicae]
MNGDSFRDWMEGVLPRLKDNCVIVMDNAPYHSVKKEKCPTTQWRKSDIIDWLTSKGEVIDNSMIIPELLKVVKQLKPLYSTYVIDEMEQNKVVLRLPPYHCELNPIELAYHTTKAEDKFWDMDNLIDELMAEQQTVVLTIGNSDDEDDSDF